MADKAEENLIMGPIGLPEEWLGGAVIFVFAIVIVALWRFPRRKG